MLLGSVGAVNRSYVWIVMTQIRNSAWSEFTPVVSIGEAIDRLPLSNSCSRQSDFSEPVKCTQKGGIAIYVCAQITSQEVLSAGGSVVHTFGIGDENFARHLQSCFKGTLAVFPQTESYVNQLSLMFDDVKGASRSILKSSDAGYFFERGWFSCTQLKVDHKLDGALHALENAPWLSTTSI